MMARIFALATALALASCVDAPETDTTSQPLAACWSNLSPGPNEVMPQLALWTGALPPDASAVQAWLIYPQTQNVNGNWVIYQVDLVNKRVPWGAVLPAGKVGGAYSLVVTSKIQATGGIRWPPGPIGPGGTGWSQVNALVRAGDILNSGLQ
jgi:hypothetical protein